jgi:hypothetical protein
MEGDYLFDISGQASFGSRRSLPILQVILTNSEVPVAVIKDTEREQAAERNIVIQEPFHFIPDAQVVSPVKVRLGRASDEPLLKITITEYVKSNETAIGLCASHIICKSVPLIYPRALLTPDDIGSRWQHSISVSSTSLALLPIPGLA